MTGAPIRTCAAPHCDVPIGWHNISGMCRAHTHLKPFCQCNTCNGRKDRTPTQLPANVRQVEVQVSQGYSTFDGRKVRVSLVREPWS